MEGYSKNYSTVQGTNLTFNLAFYDPDGSWDEGFKVRVELLQTVLFAEYSVEAEKNPYLYTFKLYPSLQTPPANYTIVVELVNKTDGTLLQKYKIQIKVVFLVVI